MVVVPPVTTAFSVTVTGTAPLVGSSALVRETESEDNEDVEVGVEVDVLGGSLPVGNTFMVTVELDVPTLFVA